MTKFRKIMLAGLTAFCLVPIARAKIVFDNLTNELVPLFIKYPHVDGTSDWKLIKLRPNETAILHLSNYVKPPIFAKIKTKMSNGTNTSTIWVNDGEYIKVDFSQGGFVGMYPR
jgi:hypothetical protein